MADQQHTNPLVKLLREWQEVMTAMESGSPTEETVERAGRLFSAMHALWKRLGADSDTLSALDRLMITSDFHRDWVNVGGWMRYFWEQAREMLLMPAPREEGQGEG